MATNNTQELYIISYLISQTENEEVVGYSSLAAKLYKFIEDSKEDEEIPNGLIEGIEDLVSGEVNKLDWSSLEEFLEYAITTDVGSMFIEIKAEEIRPNKWKPKFESGAPTPLLENKIEDMTEKENKLKEKIKTASNTELDDLIT